MLVLARLLAPSDFGLIAMIIVFSSFITMISNFGFGAALVQFRNPQENHLSSVFWINLLGGFLLMCVGVAGAPLLAAFYQEPRIADLALLISVNFFIGSFVVVPTAILQRSMRFQILGLADILSAFLAGLVAISMAFLGFGVWSMAWQLLMMTTIKTVVIWPLSGWRPQLILQKKPISELAGFGGNLLGFQVLNYFVRNLDNLLIGRFIGSFGLGIYSRSYNLMLLPLNQVTNATSRVMFPALSEIQHDKARVKRVYLRSIRLIGALTIPMMAGLLAVAEPLILGLYGDKWQEMIPIMQILCLVGIKQSVGSTTGWIFQSQGRTDLMFKWGLISAAVSTIAFVIGIQWGLLGIALAYVIRSYILWYPAITIPGRLINLTFGEFIRNLGTIFGSSIFMACIVWLLGLFLAGVWSNLAILVVQLLLGILIYSALAYILRFVEFDDLRSLLTKHDSSKGQSDKLVPSSDLST